MAAEGLPNVGQTGTDFFRVCGNDAVGFIERSG